jgi:hypothetical protein
MSTVPNELIITLHTSIPGYQKIKYIPSMTMKDINSDDKTIIFDPLIKLNKDVIDKIPKEYRIKEFFNRGLFQSLLNYTNTTPAKNLHEATMKGFIDNNINITINTIFDENSVIYIADNPYVIADIQWTKGDWKIDAKKKKKQMESAKIKNQYLHKSVVKDEIIIGENQLNQLSLSEIYGENYNKEKNINNIGGGERRIIKKENKESTQLAYYITIEMELQSGTSLTPEEMKNYKCRQKWNSVRKAYADFTGKPYVIPPVYPNSPIKNSTKKYGGRKKNITRKK